MISVVEPVVRVLSRPSFDSGSVDDFLRSRDVSGWVTDASDDASRLCEVAGRLCYMSFSCPGPGGAAGYFDRIKRHGHGSVLEHANWSLLIDGVSRSLTHELVRHRHFSYSQLSQRYVEACSCDVVKPDLVCSDEEMSRIWDEAVLGSYNAYRRLLELLNSRLVGSFGDSASLSLSKKVVRQAARTVLPSAMVTALVMTGNARSWRHLLEKRCSEAADYEIRRLCNMIYDVLLGESRLLFGDYRKIWLQDGTFELNTDYPGV